MRLYNQLRRQVEEFVPLNQTEVTIYTCGPTVYDHAHIGNLSSYIFADTLRRTLACTGYQVRHAMNYTDVDDKTIRRSQENYPDDTPRAALAKVTEGYIAVFLKDMRASGNDIRALTFLRATETIQEMKELISALHQQGFAYTADDGIYFSIEAYQKSGKTYGQLLELTTENTSAARIQNDEYDKASVHDFALWKKQKEGEPAWEFTLDGQDFTGRPGWHIECSVMSRQALGQPFDIHTGGVDLIFPHHENEIAQSTALEANPTMANFFTHNNHLLVEGKKMAKSAQNFYTLDDVIRRGFNPLVFRLLILQGHYRSQLNFTWEGLEGAENRLKHLRAVADLRFQAIPKATTANDFAGAWQAMLTPMQDNLNTPAALAALGEMTAELSERLVSQTELPQFEVFLKQLDDLFGLQLLESEDITTSTRYLINQREQARQAKEYAKADKIRAQLSNQGITVRDTADGPIWQRA